MYDIPLEKSVENIGLIGEKICGFTPDIFVSDSTYKCNVMFFDKNGEKIDEICVENNIENALFYSIPAWFYTHNKDLFYKHPFEEMVYQLTENGLSPHVNIQMDELMMPHTIYESQEKYRNNFQKYIFVGDIYETDSLIFFDYLIERQWGKAIFHKKSQIFWNKLSNKRKGDTSFDNNLNGMPIWLHAANPTNFIEVVTALDFKERVQSIEGDNFAEEELNHLKELASELEETANPVIQKVYLR